ncbi:c-type cytochrome [Trinickia dinghuensis]|uniref:Cytochrome c4 n=1 Tax=Trinickia dinghuensis TaxID=2291023 RepID=A0A3D8JU29_9BURK|nr:c-type cytochrome [Trinickia dinghuensis]RDU95891.1 cytochrome c4 [Trinickia dinghuensis]
MKKFMLLAVPIIVVLLLVLFGPSLLGVYRLQQYVTASAESYKADGGDWPHLTDVCMGCHGVKGHSLHQGYPSLAGQPALYVAAELRDFARGQRKSPQMNPLAMTMTDAQIKLLSDYYSRQSVGANRYFQADPQLRAKGEELVKSGTCTACHGARLMGQAQFPRLAAQGDDYLREQLDAFASGTRTESTGTMQRLAAAMSPEDRKAVAAYLASLKPDTK